MATGYTAALYEGKDENLREFLQHLGRGMGAYIRQRDDNPDSPPKAITVDRYYYDNVAKAIQRMNAVAAMTDGQKVQAFDAERAKIIKYNEEQRVHSDDVYYRYQERLRELNNLDWSLQHEQGPVGEFFKGYKKFVFDQMNTSIDHDCGPVYQQTVPESVEQWYDAEYISAARSLSSASKLLYEAIERAADQNKVHEAFMKWLDNLES